MEKFEKTITNHISEVAKKRRDDFEKQTNEEIKKITTIAELENLINHFNRPTVNANEFSVDDIPLTREQYENANKLVKETCKKENETNYKVYNEFRSKIQNKFKEIIRNNVFTYKGKNKDEVFEIIFNRAWEEAHGEGYKAVYNEFSDLDDFVSDIFKAANPNYIYMRL